MQPTDAAKGVGCPALVSQTQTVTSSCARCQSIRQVSKPLSRGKPLPPLITLPHLPTPFPQLLRAPGAGGQHPCGAGGGGAAHPQEVVKRAGGVGWVAAERHSGRCRADSGEHGPRGRRGKGAPKSPCAARGDTRAHRVRAMVGNWMAVVVSNGSEGRCCKAGREHWQERMEGVVVS